MAALADLPMDFSHPAWSKTIKLATDARHQWRNHDRAILQGEIALIMPVIKWHPGADDTEERYWTAMPSSRSGIVRMRNHVNG